MLQLIYNPQALGQRPNNKCPLLSHTSLLFSPVSTLPPFLHSSPYCIPCSLLLGKREMCADKAILEYDETFCLCSNVLYENICGVWNNYITIAFGIIPWGPNYWHHLLWIKGWKSDWISAVLTLGPFTMQWTQRKIQEFRVVLLCNWMGTFTAQIWYCHTTQWMCVVTRGRWRGHDESAPVWFKTRQTWQGFILNGMTHEL